MSSGWRLGASARRRTTFAVRGTRSEPPQQGEQLGRRLDEEVGAIAQLGRSFRGRDCDAHAELQVFEGYEPIEVGRVVARVERTSKVPLGEQLPDRGPLVHVQWGQYLEHLS